MERVSLYCARNYADQVFYQNTQFIGEVYGIDAHYLSVYGYQVKTGRGFTPNDYRSFRKVALVDTTAVTNLFEGKSPLGASIELQGDVYTVVGVVTLSQEFVPTINSLNDYWMYADQSAGSIYIPLSTWPTAYRFDEPQHVALKVKNTDVMTSAGKDAADLLTERQILDPDNSDFDYRSQDMLEQAQQLQSMSESTNTQLIWIASISLLVGGIGIMNIMLVTVTERTREIGIRKAIGASRGTILSQFLMEAIVLCMLGCCLGIFLSWVILQTVTAVVSSLNMTFDLDGGVVLIAVLFCFVIGVVFGLYPANKAAKMKPIDALHYGG